MRARTSFIAAGCNRHPSAADWRPSSSNSGTNNCLVAYAARKGIALWNPEDTLWRGIRRILKGHEEAVNVVHWVEVPVYNRGDGSGEKVGEEVVLVSGSVSGSGVRGVSAAVGWWGRRGGDGDGDEGEVNYALKKMEKVGGSVNGISSAMEGLIGEDGGRKGRVVAIACVDGTVGIWEAWGSRTEGQDGGITIYTNLIQTVATKPRFFPLAISLSVLPKTKGAGMILAVSGSTAHIQTYVSASPQEAFTLRATLTGHENWVRSLAFTNEVPGDYDSDLLLASASQDKYIRLWRVHEGHELPAQGKTTAGDAFGALGKSSLSNKAHRFTITGSGEGAAGRVLEYSVTFEALLMGHDDWIYTVRWRPNTADTGGTSALQLLSASADNSVSIWTPDPSSGIWLSAARLGDISDQKGSSTTTGSSGGLWIGLWSPTGSSVAALGRAGSWRLWKHELEEDRWVQRAATGGHVREVTGVSWGGPDGRYLISTSLDQTTKMYTRWVKGKGGEDSWHEFSRPQIHGYDINCVTFLPYSGGGCTFVSGADEKLLRVFDEPRGVAGLLARFEDSGHGDGSTASKIDSMPEGANQPVLGLSNKALSSSTTNNITMSLPDGEDDGPPPPQPSQPGKTQSALLSSLSQPPLEDHLCRHTLWPETDKLYGHGYEISCLASAHTLPLLATACRASSTEHAAIRIYNTKTWRQVKPKIVGGHSLSVLRLDFSADDEWLLSVSRDRSWVVYRRNEEAIGMAIGEGAREGAKEGGGEPAYVVAATMPARGHSRVVWDGKWAPVVAPRKGGGKYCPRVFATGSRDKTVKIWVEDETKQTVSFDAAHSLKFAHPVTALDFLLEVIPCCGGDKEEDRMYVLAIGFENGGISVYGGRIYTTPGEDHPGWKLLGDFSQDITPGASVSEMKWRRKVGGSEARELAVASEDGGVRVYEVTV